MAVVRLDLLHLADEGKGLLLLLLQMPGVVEKQPGEVTRSHVFCRRECLALGLGKLPSLPSFLKLDPAIWLASEACRHSPASLLDQRAVSLLGHLARRRYCPRWFPSGLCVGPKPADQATVQQRFVGSIADVGNENDARVRRAGLVGR
jgi:hypothetical protein